MQVPRWLKLQEQIDYALFELTQIKNTLEKRTGLDILIDQTTGHEKALEKRAKLLMRKIDRLKKSTTALPLKHKHDTESI